jgi:hypothetical protein
VNVTVVAVDDDGMLTVPVDPASAGSGAAVGVVPITTLFVAEVGDGEGDGDGDDAAVLTGASVVPPLEHAATAPSTMNAMSVEKQALGCIAYLQKSRAADRLAGRSRHIFRFRPRRQDELAF